MAEDQRSGTLQVEQLLDILDRVPSSKPFSRRAAELLDKHLVVSGDLPEYPLEQAENAVDPFLTIGMATYDDFDGVYFSVQAIRMYHPEIADKIEILVIDNHPNGKCAESLRTLQNWISNYRYIPAKYPQGTCARDLVFREARGEFVLCMDSHVLFPAGALKQLIDYLMEHRDSNDLLQGPILWDNLKPGSARFDPVWRSGMWGTWGEDETDSCKEPFEVEMQGLGVFGCRRRAWPGFNPRLSGFGGEEGCLHEKFRKAGGTTWCLPFLRWLHRFPRPSGVSYSNRWKDRIRNYLIWYDELGLDPARVIEHFEKHLGVEQAKATVDETKREFANPFHFFDAIYCINLDRETARWEAVTKRFTKLGVAERIRRFAAIETPHNHHIGCALSHRAIIAEAKKQNLRNVMVFEDDVIFSLNALEELSNCVDELKNREWKMFYLGGHRWGREPKTVPGCTHLKSSHGLTCTHALAYDASVYEEILEGVPDLPTEVAMWLRSWKGIDQYYAYGKEFIGQHLLTHPIIATQPNLLDQEDRLFDEAVPDLEAAQTAAKRALSAIMRRRALDQNAHLAQEQLKIDDEPNEETMASRTNAAA